MKKCPGEHGFLVTNQWNFPAFQKELILKIVELIMSINPLPLTFDFTGWLWFIFRGILFYINLFTLPLSGLSSSISLSLAPPCRPF